MNQLQDNDLKEIAFVGGLSMATASGPGMRNPSLLVGSSNPGISVRRVVVAGLLALGAARPARAQDGGYATMQPMATRADLTALADRLARGSEEDRKRATAVQTRLKEGDFRAGDKIGLILDGSVTQSDTLPVIAGSKIMVKDIGEISLAGVLRSELQAHLTKELGRYIKDVRIRATPLVRLSILGPVGKPGFFYMPTDIAVSEAIMRAGGPGSGADLNKSVIRRSTTELYDSRNMRTALTEGLTLDQLSLRDGDSIEVGEKSTSNWAKIASIVGVVSSLVWALSYVARR